MIANDEPVFCCTDCFDEPYSWRVFWCPGDGDGRKTEADKPTTEKHAKMLDCGRNKPHYAHTYVEKCHCQGNNPVAKKARDRMTAFVQRKEREA